MGYFINIWSFLMFWDSPMGGGQLDGFSDSRRGWIGRNSTPLWDICLTVLLYPEQKGGRVSDWAGSQRHYKLSMAGNRKAGWKNLFQLLDQRLPRSKFAKNSCRKKSQRQASTDLLHHLLGGQFCKTESSASALLQPYFHKGLFFHSLALLKLCNSTTTWTKSKQQHSSPKNFTLAVK